MNKKIYHITSSRDIQSLLEFKEENSDVILSHEWKGKYKDQLLDLSSLDIIVYHENDIEGLPENYCESGYVDIDLSELTNENTEKLLHELLGLDYLFRLLLL